MNPATTDLLRRASALAALALAACAAFGPGQLRVGQTADEVAQAMGTPSALYALPGGGQRIEYARGPFGQRSLHLT